MRALVLLALFAAAAVRADGPPTIHGGPGDRLVAAATLSSPGDGERLASAMKRLPAGEEGERRLGNADVAVVCRDAGCEIRGTIRVDREPRGARARLRHGTMQWVIAEDYFDRLDLPEEQLVDPQHNSPVRTFSALDGALELRAYRGGPTTVSLRLDGSLAPGDDVATYWQPPLAPEDEPSLVAVLPAGDAKRLHAALPERQKGLRYGSSGFGALQLFAKEGYAEVGIYRLPGTPRGILYGDDAGLFSVKVAASVPRTVRLFEDLALPVQVCRGAERCRQFVTKGGQVSVIAEDGGADFLAIRHR